MVGVETPLVAALDRLEARYGEQRLDRDLDPVEELVSCILSQHTSDANSFPAFYRLRARYPGWQQVVDAGVGRVADVVRSAGLANQKAKSIIAVLGKRFGVDLPRMDEVMPKHPTLGDVDSPESLAEYQAGKRAKKAALRASKG